MSCQAVQNGEVKRKGKPSIEYHNDDGKPVYYCYGWIDYGTEDLIETCSKCQKNVTYAQRDLDMIIEKEKNNMNDLCSLNITTPCINKVEYASKPKCIENWEELSKETSPTHVLDIDIEDGNGWIRPKDTEGEVGKDKHYLSTHTFYDRTNEYSTKLLQSCGFNVVLANWDEKEDK